MKEIIEYILAGLIIVSVIPVVTYIDQVMYAPKPRTVEPVVMAYFMNELNEQLLNLTASGNITLEQSILNNIITSRLLSDYPNYDFNVTITSSGITSITTAPGYVNVTSPYNGTMELLVVYNDLSFKQLSPIQIVSVPEGYIYRFAVSLYNALIVVAVLETGMARFIDYKLLNPNVYRLYIMNDNGVLCLLAPASQTVPLLTTTGTVYIYYYSNGTFDAFTSLSYKYVSNLMIFTRYFWRRRSFWAYRTISERINSSDINYLATYASTIQVNGEKFYEFKILLNNTNSQLYNYTILYGSAVYYRTLIFHGTTTTVPATDVFGFTTSIPVSATVIFPYINQTPSLTTTVYSTRSTTTLPSSTYNLAFPIYNAVLIAIKDNLGNLYIAFPYKHFMTFGDKIPANWPVDQQVYWIRLGMIDYKVVLTVWRRTI